MPRPVTGGLEITPSAGTKPMVEETHDPSRTRPVLVTTATIVHMAEDREDGFTFAEPYGGRLRDAIKEVFRRTPEVENPGVMELE
jgi:hypothetical protein